MAKNRQNSAKIIKKIDFPYNNFPKKGHFLPKMHQKKNRLRRQKKILKRSRLRRDGFKPHPPPALLYRFRPTVQPPLYLGQNALFGKKCHFFLAQKWSKNGPKVVKKWPKLPHNRRNKSRGSPRKSQRIPKMSEKWPKTLPQCNMKMHQKSKNGQKSAKIGKTYKKNRFSLQQLP